MPASSLTLTLSRRIASAKVIEVADHRGWKVEGQLPTRDVAHTEAVTRTLRNEDERSGGTDDLAILQVHDVFAREHVERLSPVVVNMHRRSEPGRFSVFQYRHDTARFVRARLHGHLKVAQVDDPPFTRGQ